MFILNVFHLLLALILIVEQVFTMVPVANSEVFGIANVRQTHTRSPSTNPRSIRVHVTAFGKTRDIQLFPREEAIFSPDFQGFVADVDKNGKIIIEKILHSRAVQNDIHSKLYTDVTGTVSLYVERRNGHIALEGVLDEETRITNDFNRQGRSLSEPVNHVVFRRLEKHEETCRSVFPNITGTRLDSQQLDDEPRALPTQVNIEVTLVIDFKTTLAFNHNLDDIKKYIGVFFGSVNSRYGPIDTPKISFVVTGIILTNTEAAQTFLRISPTPPLLDSQATLFAFGEWLVPMRPNLPPNDIIIWMTGLDFASNVVGIAFVGGVCWLASNMNVNTGLVRDISYSGIHTMAHEIAHLLGSSHDGEVIDSPPGNPGAKSCPWSDGYIMSYEFGTPNTFLFSPCSINQMKFTINSSRASCVLDNPRSAVAPINTTFPGQIKSLDDQCKSRHGNDSSFYEPRLFEVCVKMWCGPAVQTGSFSIFTSGPSLEGSRCGVNKICISGICKDSPVTG